MKRDIVLLNDTSKNKTGPSINPWGTPHVMLADLKSWMETIHVIYVYLIAVFVSGYLCGLVVGSLAELPPPVHACASLCLCNTNKSTKRGPTH